MPDINPISSNEDIMREAAENKPETSPQPETPNPTIPPTPISEPVSTAPAQPQPASSVSVAPVAPQPVGYRPPAVSIAQPVMRRYFKYKLPVTSYILAVFYIIVAVYLLWIITQFLSQINRYSYSGSSSNYGSGLVVIALLIAAAIVVTVALFSGTKRMWYVAITISVLIAGCQLYVLGKTISSISGSSSYGVDLGQYIAYYSVYFMPYIPYLLLPAATIGYLLTPKARLAYQ